MKIDRKSWHYRLARIAAYNHWDGEDLCTYSRSVFAGFIFTAFLAYIFACVLCAIWYWAFGSGVMTFMEWVGSGVIGVSLGVAMVGGLIVGGVKAKDAYDSKYAASNKPQGFLAARYQAWKEKTCILLDFE